MQQILRELKGETERFIIITGDFNIPLSITDRTIRQKINVEIEDLNNTINN
jgi:hypothetical protein